MIRKLNPPGWKEVRLVDLCDIVIGKTPSRGNPTFWGGDHCWAKISDLKNEYIYNTEETISDEGAKVCKGRLLKQGTLLYSFKLSIGKAAFAGVHLYTNEAIAGLIPKDQEQIKSTFLRYAMSSIDPMQHTGHAAKGRTLNKKTLGALMIPVAPLKDQERIVAILDEQLALVKRAQEAAQDQLNHIDSLFESFLYTAFRGSI